MKIRKLNKLYTVGIIVALLGCVVDLAQVNSENVVSIPLQPQVTEKITLDLRGMDIRDIFRLFSINTGKTIVPGKNVAGRVDLFINDTTYTEALDVIVASQGLALATKDEIVYVYTKEEFLAEYGIEYKDKRILKTFYFKYANADKVFQLLNEMKSDKGRIVVDKASSTLIALDLPEKIQLMTDTLVTVDKPLKTNIYKLNYASVAQMKSAVDSMLTPEIGKSVADERTSTLLVKDLPSVMTSIDKLIEALDAESKQVFIKAEIVQVTFTDSNKQGIDWSKVMPQLKLDKLTFQSDFNVLPSAAPNYGKVSVGVAGVNTYSGYAEFLKEQGRVKVLSRPQISVIDKQEATIHVGVQQPFISSTRSENDTSQSESYSDTIEYKDIGIKLKVKPVIGNDGFVTLELAPEISSIKETLTTNAGSIIPVLEKTSANTKLKVKNGSMIIMAGLIQNKKTNDEAGIPILRKVPLLGMMFGNKEKTEEKTETIIFLTPHLVDGSESMFSEEFERSLGSNEMPDEYKSKYIENEIKKIATESHEPK